MMVIQDRKDNNEYGIVHRDNPIEGFSCGWWITGLRKNNKTIKKISDKEIIEDFDYTGEMKIPFAIKNKIDNKIWTISHRDQAASEGMAQGWWLMGMADTKQIKMISDKELTEEFEFSGNLA